MVSGMFEGGDFGPLLFGLSAEFSPHTYRCYNDGEMNPLLANNGPLRIADTMSRRIFRSIVIALLVATMSVSPPAPARRRGFRVAPRPAGGLGLLHRRADGLAPPADFQKAGLPPAGPAPSRQRGRGDPVRRPEDRACVRPVERLRRLSRRPADG